MTDTICVVGLGYVGLPIAVAFDNEGNEVIGYDVDAEKVRALKDGRSHVDDVSSAALTESDITLTDDPTLIGDAEFVIITVPTPVDDLENPDMTFVKQAGRTVGENITPGTTVVLESTVFPGATNNVLVPAVESASGYTAGEEFVVGYSPERISPGSRGIRDAVKIVSGQTEQVRDDLARLYQPIADEGVFRASTIETAEAAKVIENVQRDINIALVNELAVACEYLDLDTLEVLEAAGTKWNFHTDYSPGLVGGHCIPVDPLFFAHKTKREGFAPKLLLQAREINEYMPKHVVELTIKALNQCGKVPRQSRLLVLGLAYKPNVGDIRTSANGDVVAKLAEYGADIVGFDPHASVAEMRTEFDIEIAEMLSFEGFDGVLVLTPHDEFESIDLEAMVTELTDSAFLIDLEGLFDPQAAEANGLLYRRL